MLSSPKFLLRVEREPAGSKPGNIYRLTDLELASRLSFFLWRSMPDDDLLGCADRGTLKQPAVLATQVRRMLKDAKSQALVENFGGQWLELRKLESVKPDRARYPVAAYFLRGGGTRARRLPRHDPFPISSGPGGAPRRRCSDRTRRGRPASCRSSARG